MVAVPAAPTPETHLDAADVLPHDLQRVEQGGQHHHRGVVLVVVEDRDVELLAQPLLDLEAAGRRDVLQVDPPEGGGNHLDRLHDLAGILGGEWDRERVDPGELLEEHGLALHHRHRRLGADVAEPQHRGAVGDDRDRVLLDGQRERPAGVVLDREADPGHPRGVGHAEVVPTADRHLAVDLDLAPQVHQEGAIRDIGDADPGRRLDPVDDVMGVTAVAGLDGDVPEHPLPGHLDQVHRPDVAAGLPDDRGDAAQHAGLVLDLETGGEAVGGAGGDGHQFLTVSNFSSWRALRR
jgi:hypothetical protein